MSLLVAQPHADRLSRGEEAEGLGAVDADAWNALASAGSAALSHEYLTAWERCELPGLQSRPLFLYESGSERLVAACPACFYKLDVVGLRLPIASRLMEPIRRLWPGFLYASTYELGSTAPLSDPFLAADPGLRASAVRELVTEGLETGRRHGAHFLLVQNFPSLTGPTAETLRRLGFAGIPIMPTAVVDLAYDSFEDYLAAMRAPYRRRARQTMKRSRDLHVERLEDFSELADELARLWRLVYDRAGELRREVLPPVFFRAMAKLEGSSVLLVRRGDGSIAAFALLLADHPWLAFLQCGFDAAAGQSEGAYFRLLYEIVRAGIAGRFEQLDLGVTTMAPKLDVGAVPVPLFAWVKHRNPVIQTLLRAVANGPLRTPRLEPRRVFKEPPASARELVARRGLPG